MVRVVSLSGLGFSAPFDDRDDDHVVDCGSIDSVPFFLTPEERQERREYQLSLLMKKVARQPSAIQIGRPKTRGVQ